MNKFWLLPLAAFAVIAEAAPLNPAVVHKEVKIVRRPITVSVVGPDLAACPADGKVTVEAMIRHLTGAIEKELSRRPDLIVLSETCDMWLEMPDEQRHDWIAMRGDKILNVLREYAKKYHTYIVYPTYRELGNRRYCNSAFLIDREGDVVSVYDKVYPTVYEIDFGVVPGQGPVIAETDFGTLGMVICFDLNFWELLDRYAALRPDVITFSSYYHGDFMLQAWAYKCRAHLIASTVGRLEKDVFTPCGTPQRVEHNYFYTFSERINTNCAVVHIDFNWEKLQAACDKYGPVLRIDTARGVGAVTLFCDDPAIPIHDIIREFGIELWDDYYRRSTEAAVRARAKAASTTCSVKKAAAHANDEK